MGPGLCDALLTSDEDRIQQMGARAMGGSPGSTTDTLFHNVSWLQPRTDEDCYYRLESLGMPEEKIFYHNDQVRAPVSSSALTSPGRCPRVLAGAVGHV